MAPISSYTEKQVRDLIKTSESGMPYPDSTTQSTKNLTVNHTGPDIHYIGNRVYAFSGAVAQSTSEQTLLDFTSGSGYIVATLTMTAPIMMDNVHIGSGGVRGWQLDFNGQTVGLYKATANPENMPADMEVQILIPPFTAVTLVCIDTTDNANFLGTANITGEVFNA